MMLEIYGWTLLVLFPIGYAAFITDIEWHFKMLNLLIYTLIVGLFFSLGIYHLCQ